MQQQDETRNILEFGAAYTRGFTVTMKYMDKIEPYQTATKYELCLHFVGCIVYVK